MTEYAICFAISAALMLTGYFCAAVRFRKELARLYGLTAERALLECRVKDLMRMVSVKQPPRDDKGRFV